MPPTRRGPLTRAEATKYQETSRHAFALTYDVPHTFQSCRCEPIEFMREQLLADRDAELDVARIEGFVHAR